MYQNGYSQYKIANNYNVKQPAISRVLKSTKVGGLLVSQAG